MIRGTAVPYGTEFFRVASGSEICLSAIANLGAAKQPSKEGEAGPVRRSVAKEEVTSVFKTEEPPCELDSFPGGIL